MKRCSKCICPETYPGIQFNKDGICNFCLNCERQKPLGEKELRKILASSKEKKYDCIVPLSGGRDSSFVLYMAKNYGLNALAVNYDNEFCSKQAQINMKNACKILGVDFISFRSKINIGKKIVASHLKTLIPSGVSACLTSSSVCSACGYGYRAVVYRVAEKEEIPVILWGDSTIEIPNPHLEKYRRKYRVKPIKKLFSFQIFHYLRYLFYRLLQRYEFRVPGNRILSFGKPLLKNKKIKEIHFYDYIEWDRTKIKQIIMENLDWQKPAEKASSWRFDCKLHSFSNYICKRTLGFSADLDGYCNMVRDGKMTREEAMRQEEYLDRFSKEMEHLLINDLGLSRKEIKKLLSSS